MTGLEVVTRNKNVPGNYVAFTLEVIELLGREAHCFDAEGHSTHRRILVCLATPVQG